MKIQWLGTAASEGWPALFCACESCQEATRRGGREIRTRSSALIDDVLLLELSPDIMHHKVANALDLAAVRDIFITHQHEDHFQPNNLQFLHPVCAHNHSHIPVHVWGNDEVVSQIPPDNSGVSYPLYQAHIVNPGDVIDAAHHRVTVLPAIHSAPHSLFYLIMNSNAAFLYAHDTDFFSAEAWAILETALNGRPLSAVSMDATDGPRPHIQLGHMCFEQNIVLREKLIALGMATETTRFVSSHFDHNNEMCYRESCEYMAPYSIEIAYDGMMITL